MKLFRFQFKPGQCTANSIKLLPILISIALFSSLQMSVYASDPVTIVQKPLMNRPELLIPGEYFEIQCLVPSASVGWSVQLYMPYKTVDLGITVGNYTGGMQYLRAEVPPSTPFELYDLIVHTPSGDIDTVRHAVRVLQEYKSTFYFVHLPDCHLPAVSWVGFYDDDNTVPEYLQVLSEISLINPEFILQTGDLVDNGQSDAQYAQAQELTEQCQVPMFITGGNHDLWYDGHSFWHRYFGSVMDYSFLYDDIRFFGLEMYDIPSKTYTSEQMTWLQNALNQSIDDNELSRILFTHYDESRQITGTFVDQYQVDGLIYGHTHLNGANTLGLRDAPKLNTSYTMNDNGEYRLIKVVDGQITEYPVIKFRNLLTNIAPANDGNSWTMQAEIINNTDVDLEGALVKLHVLNGGTPTTSEGTIIQSIVYDANRKRVVYVSVDVPAHSTITVVVENGGSGSVPPIMTSYFPKLDTLIYGGQTLNLSATGNRALDFTWFVDGDEVKSETASSSAYAYQPAITFEGSVKIDVEADGAPLFDEQSWTVHVKKSTGKPELTSNSRNFFPHNETLELTWIEPVDDVGVFEYGLIPGQYIGSVHEIGSSNTVSFIPEDEGMGLGIYFCRITSGGLAGDEFPIVIESPQAPQMLGPVGNVQTLKPVFQWEAVQGVPFYFVILTDQEVILTEDEATGDYSLEGANPIWAVLTSETSVPYGIPDPSGTFTSFPAPLTRGQEYWWVVLNCYGNAPELTSTVQSGVSRFKVDLPLPDLAAPTLISPVDAAVEDGARILFRWSAVEGAIGYNFYPYKIETEEGIEVVRPIWETVLTTTNTLIEYEAARVLVKGRYKWRIAALDVDGTESPSDIRTFEYDAPVSTLTIYTRDSRGTVSTSDDKVLPRVSVNYDAISGVDMGLPLSTDDSGSRPDLVFTPGRYRFTAVKDGFEPTVIELDMAEEQTQSIFFRMNPDPSTVTGSVGDDEGNAVAAATVFAQHALHADITRQVSSAQNGDFNISLTPGPWQLHAVKPGYQESEIRSVSVAIGEVLQLDAVLEMMKNKNQINGSIVNTAGKSIYGAKVVIKGSGESMSQTTDADGLFSFSVRDDVWSINVSKAGFTSPAQRSITVSGGTIFQVTPSMVLTPANAMISGTVTDGKKAVGQALIRVVPASGAVLTTESDSYGQYTLSLNAGTYVVTAEKQGYSTGAGKTINTGPGETVSGVLLLLTANSGEVSGSATLDGFTPLPDVLITIDGMSALTDAAGRYAIPIAPGSYTVAAAKTGYLVTNPHDVIINPGQKADGVDFILTPNASVVSGRILFDGVGVAGAKVVAVNGITLDVNADDEGYYTLSLQAGTYQLHAEKTGFISNTINVQVGQAQTLDGRNIVLERNIVTVHGVVKDKDSHELLMNVLITVENTGISTTSKADGTYVLELEPHINGYTIVASKAGYISKNADTGALTAGIDRGSNYDLEASTTMLSGTVRDKSADPVDNAVVRAEIGSTIYQTITTADGAYALNLSPLGGSYTITASKTGYTFPDISKIVILQSGEELRSYSLELQKNFGRIKGQVTDLAANGAIALAAIDLSDGSGIVATAISDDDGNYDFASEDRQLFLPAGTYTLAASGEGYADTSVTAITLIGGDTVVVDVSLRKYGKHIAGTVSDGAGPLAGATVALVSQAEDIRMNMVSNADGIYCFDALDAGTYSISASKAGYTAPDAVIVMATSDDLQLLLSKNSGRIHGRIYNLKTQKRLGGVQVRIHDGHGNEMQTTANSSGVYDTKPIRMLPIVYPYDVQASMPGFADTTATGKLATSVDSVNIEMRPLYGNVSGKVMSIEDSIGMAEVRITVRKGSSIWTDTTNTAGEYIFTDLPASDYTLYVEEPGYLGSPASHSLNLWSGPILKDVDIYLEEVELAELSITGPLLVQGGSVASFNYAAKTADGRQMNVDPVWSVDAITAVDSVGASGKIYPKIDFIGPLWIRLTDSYTDFMDSLRIHVVASIEPGDGARIFRDYRGGFFALDTNSVVQPISFSVKYPAVPQVKKVMRDYLAVGKIYALQPAYLILNSPMTMTLPLGVSLAAAKQDASRQMADIAASVAAVAPEDIRLGMWDASRLKWDIRTGITEIDRISIDSDTLAQWTLLIPTEKLGIRAYSALPNPFSPVLGPLNIGFTLTSRASTYLAVTVKLYNMNGTLVRELLVDQQIIKDEPYILEWDGLTDYGDMALNGRYMLYITARDGQDTATLLKSVVLVK
ncbi:carboxypeptidase regulatory-like domain-containing protein [bacterium]|nr:carboxypeptidase regulatory-like domain-containing protein [bacterium]